MDFTCAHILSTNQFGRDDVDRLFAVADKMQPYARREKSNHALAGALLGSMFFEPSTRTRISFGCAFHLLGGRVNETTGFEHSAIAKGESLYDTARVLSGYSDVIVMRHPEAGSVGRFAEASRVPVINGGDGSNEHPTQALLDLYTIQRERRRTGGSLDKLRIALIGDLKYGRTAHSLCRLLCLYERPCIKLISPERLGMPELELESMRASGADVVLSDDMKAHINDVDIVYATRIQEERFEYPDEAAQYRTLYHLNEAIYTSHCQPHTVIMHPMPRDSRLGESELGADLNEHPNLAIFRQADNGILVRMALFALIFGVADTLDRSERPLPWRSLRRS